MTATVSHEILRNDKSDFKFFNKILFIEKDEYNCNKDFKMFIPLYEFTDNFNQTHIRYWKIEAGEYGYGLRSWWLEHQINKYNIIVLD